MSIVATAMAVQTLLRTVKKERSETWGGAPATCHETFLTSKQARYDQQEAFMIIWVCLKMLCTPLYPMVLLIIIPFLNGYFIGNINPTFSDKPIYAKDSSANIAVQMHHPHPSTIIKHGLLENSPSSSVIFPANETSIWATGDFPASRETTEFGFCFSKRVQVQT